MWQVVEDYLRSNFITGPELAQRSGVAPALIDRLVAAECLPRPSYTVQPSFAVHSYFGDRTHDGEVVSYYHPALVDLARTLGEDARTRSLDELREEGRARFIAEYRKELSRSGALEEGLLVGVDLDELAASEWRSWCDGTYGLCTRGNDPAAIVRKEMAMRRIRRITDDGTRAELTPQERAELVPAVDALDDAAPAFAPDEREQSSRGRWVDAIRARYGLDQTVPLSRS